MTRQCAIFVLLFLVVTDEVFMTEASSSLNIQCKKLSGNLCLHSNLRDLQLTYSDGCNTINCNKGRMQTTYKSCPPEEDNNREHKMYCDQHRSAFNFKSRSTSISLKCSGITVSRFEIACRSKKYELSGITVTDGCNELICKNGGVTMKVNGEKCMPENPGIEQQVEYCNEIREIYKKQLRKYEAKSRNTEPIVKCSRLSSKSCSKINRELDFSDGCNQIQCRNRQALTTYMNCPDEVDGNQKHEKYCNKLRLKFRLLLESSVKSRRNKDGVKCNGVSAETFSGPCKEFGKTISGTVVSDGCNFFTCEDGKVTTEKSQKPCKPEDRSDRDERWFCDKVRSKYYFSIPQYDGGYSSTPQKGGYSSTPQKGGYSSTPQKGGYSSTPQKGGYSSTPQKGGYRRTYQKGGYNSTPQKGGYRRTYQKGGYRRTYQKGGYKRTYQKGGYSSTPRGQRDRNAQKRTGVTCSGISNHLCEFYDSDKSFSDGCNMFRCGHSDMNLRYCPPENYNHMKYCQNLRHRYFEVIRNATPKNAHDG